MLKHNLIHPKGFTDPEDYRRLRIRLQEINYTREGILEVLGRSGQEIPHSTDIPPLLHRTNGGSPLETCIRLFLMGVAVPAAMAKQALQPVSLERCKAAGLIKVKDGQVAGKLNLQPYNELLFAHDPFHVLAHGGQADWVMGIGNSTMMLSNLTMRRHVEQMLDLCSGCGSHALLAAKHSGRVFAVDRNPRATAYCSFNAQLNHMDNVESVTGNLFEPVASQRFGLVVANPPFVISPSTKFIYRDSGVRGDEFCRQLIREAPKHLGGGGYLLMLFNFAYYKNQNWKERLSQWFKEIGCDVWLLQTRTRDVSIYAANWIKSTEGHDSNRFSKAYEQWMQYYEQEGIEEIGDFTLIMRRKERGKNWFWLDDSPENIIGQAGDEIINAFEIRDFLESATDEMLLKTSLRVAKAVRLLQEFEADNGAWSGGPAELILTRGLSYKCKVDMYVAGLVARCNGQRPLIELIKELAGVLECDLNTLIRQLTGHIRHLIEKGYLHPEKISQT